MKIFNFSLKQHKCMLETPNNYFDHISIMKIPKIWPIYDYIGSKMVKNRLKIFSAWIMRGVAYTKLQKMHTR